MKKYLVLFLILSGCATTFKNISDVEVNESFPHNEIQKIAIIRFEVLDREKDRLGSRTVTIQDAGNILATLTAIELKKWGKYVVLNRNSLNEELRLKNLREKDFLRNGNYSELGKLLGVDAVVIGRVEDYNVSYSTISSKFKLILTLVNNVSFTASCIDVTTNETIWSFRVAGSSKKENERVLASKLITDAVSTLKTKLK